MISARSLTVPSTKPLGIVPSALITISITITHIFHSLFVCFIFCFFFNCFFVCFVLFWGWGFFCLFAWGFFRGCSPARSKYLSLFLFSLIFHSVVRWDGKIHKMTSFFFWWVGAGFFSWSGFLAGVRSFVCI